MMGNNYPSTSENHIPEILAPAGTPEALHAAVNAGCDAVYLGGNLFGARAFAGNFTPEELVEAIDYCHLFGVKVYMTVNTLLKEEELKQLAPYMRPFYQAGLDGVIVQDPGVVRVLKRFFPDLPLHASTQMSVASASGAAFLKRQGFVRIVPARELSLEEIRMMKEQAGMEIETFVHGAMCYAYSGKCLFSSFLGGRSGNRGRCAQPCRKSYTALSGEKGYLMSMKDMCTLEILPQLMDAGIDSFKIEGRMKNPSYVAATVDAYRQARDRYLCLQQEAADGNRRKPGWGELSASVQKEYLQLAARLTGDMQDIYNRGGFCSGYYFLEKGLEMMAADRPNHAGRRIGTVEAIDHPQVRIHLQKDLHAQDVLEIRQTGTELTSNVEGAAGSRISLKGKDLKQIKAGMEVYRTRNHVLLNRIEQELIAPEKVIWAEALIRAKEGEPLSITLSEPVSSGLPEGESMKTGIQVTVQGNPVQRAGQRPVTAEQLIAKMQKTGGSHVAVKTACIADEHIFVPMSEFNVLRREAVELWKQALVRRYHRPAAGNESNAWAERAGDDR